MYQQITPPRCPNTSCKNHLDPSPGFLRRKGWFWVKCRSHPIARSLCKACGRTFSTQTFRVDYRDHRPHQNEAIFEGLVSGVSYRKLSRNLGMNVSSVQRKAIKLGRQLAALHRNLTHGLSAGRAYVLDEAETFETDSVRRVTVALLVESKSWFIVGTAAAPIRRLAPPGTRRRARQDAEEQKRGRRRDLSASAVASVLGFLSPDTGRGALSLISDMKPLYRRLAREIYGDDLKQHVRVSSKEPRGTSNPLFPVNLTLGILRSEVGRLQRRSWKVSKRCDRLDLHLCMFASFRNYVCRRFNYDKPGDSPAALLGLLPRALSKKEALCWRQDWGAISIHPLSRCGAWTVRGRSPALAYTASMA